MTQTQPPATTTPTSLTITRIVNAPREKVYQAFADPEKLAKWYACGGMSTDINKLELKRGGAFHLRMHGPTAKGQQENIMIGAFEEVVPNERLVHSWSWKSDDPEMRAESTVTITLKTVDGGTEVTLEHTGLPSDEQVRSHMEGWTEIMDNLVMQF